MDFDFDRLLDPRPMALEMGYKQLPSGVLHVAVRTDLHNCTGKMFDWWFTQNIGTREYRWWHPIDHLSSKSTFTTPGVNVGMRHVVEEKMTNLPPVGIIVQFRDPCEIYDRAALDAARREGRTSGLVFGHAGMQGDEHYDSEGRLLGSRVLHHCRDTPWGTVLRSCFLFGFDLAAKGCPADEVASHIHPDLGPNLLQHCYDEFTFLSRVLPSIYTAEGVAPEQVVRPW